MERIKLKRVRRTRRKAGLRKALMGTSARPRLSVFRSLNHIYAQIIDDLEGKTLAAASTAEKKNKAKSGGNCDAAKAVGKTLAEKAKKAGVTQVIFDRNGFSYHGRIKALADAAREGGLKF
ncbi:MAG: 50S ribosomal protein L18 [Planctomycetes bacterium]|nr:50S ribosomal protein L18 [Planctomycetota bacterium]